MIEMRDKLIELIKRCGNEMMEFDIDEETNLVEDLGYSSLNLIELIVELEMEFGIEIPDEVLNIETLSMFKNIFTVVENSTAKEM
ncbi:MAG TPA: phosphopantetheine-binding protein, partial [Sedimentibacter sp.]|nr:phosphopantetheine-binding protein [Sedimentibacter sp.]